MKFLLLFLSIYILSCDYGSFDKDKRQIMAKDAVRQQLPRHSRNFDITAFREDTLHNLPDSNFDRPLGYTLNYEYTDSTGQLQTKQATVVFTPEGHSVIKTISNSKSNQ